MAFERKDRVSDTTATTGTGTLTLSGVAQVGYRSFSSAHTSSATVRYAISRGAEWEVGEGIYTASGNTLTRTTVLASSNSGSLVNFSAGTKTVVSTLTAGEVDKFVLAETDPVTGVIETLTTGSAFFYPPSTNGIRTVLIGDSYIDREMEYTTDNRTHQTMWGTVMWANFFLGSPLNIVKEMGIGGERTSDIFSRVDRVAAYAPKIIFLSCGINDLKLTVNPGSSIVTGDAYASDSRQVELPYVQGIYEQIIASLVNTGASVFLMAISPPGNGATNASAQLSYRALLLNRWLQYKAHQSSNLHYVDVHRVTQDATSATGDVRAGHYSDEIHKSNLGAFYSGKYLAAQLKPFLAANLTDRLPISLLDTYSSNVVAGTAVTATGSSMTVTLNNLNSGAVFRRFQPGDVVSVGVPSVGYTEFNGLYTLSSVTDATVTMPSSVAAGSYTGTVKVSNGTQLFANPLFTTQTGGGVTGGITLTSGALPAFTTVSGPAGSSVIVTYEAHTDLDGVADNLGSWLVCEITGGANANIKILFAAAKSNPATSYSGRCFPGDTVHVCGDLSVTAISGVYSLSAGMTTNYYDEAGSLISGTLECLKRSASSTDAHPNQTMRGSFVTCDWQFPSGALADVNTIDGQVNVVFGAGGGSCTLKIGRYGIYRVDHPTRDVTEPACYQ